MCVLCLFSGLFCGRARVQVCMPSPFVFSFILLLIVGRVRSSATPPKASGGAEQQRRPQPSTIKKQRSVSPPRGRAGGRGWGALKVPFSREAIATNQ